MKALKMKRCVLILIGVLFSMVGFSQCVTSASNYNTLSGAQGSGTLTTASEWTSSTPPPYALNASNDSYTIPNGIIVEISSANFAMNHNLIVYGTLLITGKLNLATGKTIIVPSGGLVTCCSDFPAAGTATCGTSDKISIGGTAAWSGNGGGGANSGGPFSGPTSLTPNGFGNLYTWKGTTSNWTVATNWTPSRTTPDVADVLTFNASGIIKNITNIPTQTITSMVVTGSSSYTFIPTGTQTLTLTSTLQNALQIDNLSSLAIGDVSNTQNISLSAGGTASIGGQLNLVLGSLGVSSATLLLHTSSTPLARTSGQVTANSSSTIKFGDTGLTSGSTIVLPNSIFNGAPTIGTLIINRTNDATLGNQTITVGTSATFTLGVLNTNSTGRIAFSSSSIPAVESTSSYISGYADMGSSAVGTGSLSYLGMTIASGTDNLGSVTLTRITGPAGVNSFSGKNSIAASWIVAGSAAAPAGRNVSFGWQSAFDNLSTASLKYQIYLSTGSGFNPIGALQSLSAQGPPRQSNTASTTTINGTYTLSDENNALPITLNNFSGRQKLNEVILKWTTNSEVNFYYFSIEKSLDGKSFFEIGRVNGNGTTIEQHSYNFTDKNPIIGKNYYRLTSVDFDGYKETFYVISVDYSNEKDFSVFPVPSDGMKLSAAINFTSDKGYTITILNNLGNPLGNYTTTNPEVEFSFNEPLPNGVYYAKLSSPDFNKVIRFIVSR